LEELEEIDPIDCHQYLENNFPNFFELVEDTKLEKELNQFCTKLDKQVKDFYESKQNEK
jgi:hypothetical protein